MKIFEINFEHEKIFTKLTFDEDRLRWKWFFFFYLVKNLTIFSELSATILNNNCKEIFSNLKQSMKMALKYRSWEWQMFLCKINIYLSIQIYITSTHWTEGKSMERTFSIVVSQKTIIIKRSYFWINIHLPSGSAVQCGRLWNILMTF